MSRTYASVEQSKVLQEILPISSSDLEYLFLKRDGSGSRSACGGYYPFSEDFGLLPHPFQESICW